MFRIQEKDGAINGPNWQFTEGTPGPGGHQPTRITAKLLNDVQDELINLVEEAALKPSATDQSQVIAAVNVLAGWMADRRTTERYVVGAGGHFGSITEAVAAVPAGSSILVAQTHEIVQPVKIEKDFIAITFRWGTRLSRGQFMNQDYMFEVSKDGFLLDGLNAEGFKQLVKFSQPPPRFAFIRNSTLKGGTAPTTGGTPQFLDLSTVVVF